MVTGMARISEILQPLLILSDPKDPSLFQQAAGKVNPWIKLSQDFAPKDPKLFLVALEFGLLFGFV
jgi:hypothetical protein